MHSKAYRAYNKRTKLIEESIHIVFDDGRLSSSLFRELRLCRYDNDDEEEEEARAKSNMEHKAPHQDSTPENDMPLTSEESHAINEEEPSPGDPKEETVHALRHGYKYKSYHLPDNLLIDISTGIRTRTFLQNFRVFSSFVSLIEHKNYLEALDDSKCYARRAWSI